MNEDKKVTEKPIEISAELLSPEALSGIIENFILREGTDYGLVEVLYERKVAQLHKQIDRGEIKIVFDQASETVSLLTLQDFKHLTSLLK